MRHQLATEQKTAGRARDADWQLLLLGVLVVSAAYALWHLGHGWTSWDDGTLAQTAERVTQGQLSHRDFDDVYTGGLAVLNAAGVAKLFGKPRPVGRKQAPGASLTEVHVPVPWPGT